MALRCANIRAPGPPSAPVATAVTAWESVCSGTLLPLRTTMTSCSCSFSAFDRGRSFLAPFHLQIQGCEMQSCMTACRVISLLLMLCNADPAKDISGCSEYQERDSDQYQSDYIQNPLKQPGLCGKNVKVGPKEPCL